MILWELSHTSTLFHDYIGFSNITFGDKLYFDSLCFHYQYIVLSITNPYVTSSFLTQGGRQQPTGG